MLGLIIVGIYAAMQIFAIVCVIVGYLTPSRAILDTTSTHAML